MSVTTGDTQREAAALADSLTSQAAPSQLQNEQNVPVHVIQAMREELRAEKEKNEAFRNHLQMMQWQQNQAPAQAPANPFGNADPEDSIKVKDAERLLSDFEQRTNAQLAEIKLASRTPDYKEVIQKYLPKAAQEDPELLEEIKRSSNPYKTAYLAAKASQAYQDEQYVKRGVNQSQMQAPPAPKPDPEMEKLIHNSKQSGNLSSVGNQASNSKYPAFSSMSDAEFMKYKSERKFASRSK